MFRFALITTDGDELGTIAFARRDFNPGDIIPHGREPSLRVVNVIWPERESELPLLLVEFASET